MWPLGTHSSLVYLQDILTARHDNLLRLADLRMKQIETEAELVREWDKKTCWSWWNVCESCQLPLVLQLTIVVFWWSRIPKIS